MTGRNPHARGPQASREFALHCRAVAVLASNGWPVDLIATLTGDTVPTVRRHVRAGMRE